MPTPTPNFTMVLDGIMITILLGSTQPIHLNRQIYAKTLHFKHFGLKLRKHVRQNNLHTLQCPRPITSFELKCLI